MEILGLAYLTGLTCLLFRYIKKHRSYCDEDICFFSVSDQIDELDRTKQALYSIEDLITEINICDPKDHDKFIRLEWSDNTGESFAYDLWIDGKNEASELLIGIACSERKQLRSSIRQQIRELNERCNGNGNEIYNRTVFRSNDYDHENNNDYCNGNDNEIYCKGETVNAGH